MRQVDYHSINPQPLQDPRTIEARRVVSEFLDLPEEMRLSRRAPIDQKVFTNPEVRSALHKLYGDTCGFCETKLSPNSLGIDHYRPIANAVSGRKNLPHHYSWLAYSWENLVLSCHQCNLRKTGYFSLVSGKRAALKAPLAEIRAQERPGLLDPGFDAPFKHLDFTLDGRVHARTRRGEATINILNLNRDGLVEARGRAFSHFEIQLRLGDKEDAIMLLHQVSEPSTLHSGAMQILRYHFLSALAERVGSFKFGFNEAVGLIGNLLERASPEDITAAVDLLKEPKKGTRAPKPKRALRTFTSPIRRIKIENFKSISHIEIDLASSEQGNKNTPALMLLGENATGKTSVLQAVTLALAGAEKANKIVDAKTLVPSEARKRNHGLSASPKVLVEFSEGEPAELYIKEGRFTGTEAPRANVIAYSSSRYFKPRSRRTRSGARGLLDPTWGLPDPDAWLKTLNADQFQNVARALAEIMALPRQAYIKHDPTLGTVVVDGELITPIAEHSDGYRSIFATMVDMLNVLRNGRDLLDAEGVVLIDEIETHLHPRWKMRLMAAMRAALPRVQFIVTTHDPLCLRGMGYGEVQVMTRNKHGDIVLLPDLPDVAGMRIDQILMSEHFGLQSTLDPGLEAVFEEYYALLRLKGHDEASLRKIEMLREQINQTQAIGQTERERRMLAAIDRHLANQASDSVVRAQQERALDAELDAIWLEAEAKPE